MSNKPSLCPCGSSKNYDDCCGRYHKGALPENALALMRSRYSAYAKHLPDYLIKTAHPDNPSYTEDFVLWRDGILLFCRSTSFDGLEILEFVDGKEKATVTFIAHLKQGSHDGTFKEKSNFVKVGNQWLYKDGEIKYLRDISE